MMISRTPGMDFDHPAPGRRLPSVRAGAQGLAEALGAGVGFGFFFVLLGQAPEQSGIWPLIGTRISMVVSVAVLAVITKSSVRPESEMRRSLLWLGFINLTADLFYLLATRVGLLSLVAVITSLYPVATVALARVLLKERMVKQQVMGAGFAAMSVVLISLRTI